MPRPAIGSSWPKNPDSPTVRPRGFATVSRSAGFFSSAATSSAMRCASSCARCRLQLVLDLRPHFGQRLRRRGPLLDDLDDVEAELRLHQVAELAGLQRERRLVELRHHLALAEEVEVAALGLAGFVLRVLLRELREVRARLDLGAAGLRPASSRRLVLALGLEQDVAGADLLGRRVLLDVVFVVALDLLAASPWCGCGCACTSISA